MSVEYFILPIILKYTKYKISNCSYVNKGFRDRYLLSKNGFSIPSVIKPCRSLESFKRGSTKAFSDLVLVFEAAAVEVLPALALPLSLLLFSLQLLSPSSIPPLECLNILHAKRKQ